MTRNMILRTLGCGGLWLLFAGVATAQYNPFPTLSPGSRFAPYARSSGYVPSTGGPRLSPYLNLLRGGNPAANYFLGVVPEIERRRFESEAIAGFRALEQRVDAPATGNGDPLFPRLSQTGHEVQFMNPAPYYNTGGRTNSQTPQTFGPQNRRR